MIIEVCAGWIKSCPIIGKFNYENIAGNDVYSFEYDETWLMNNYVFLGPDINEYLGRQYSNSKNMFGFLEDCCPDRWGRMLIERNESIIAIKEHRKSKHLSEVDYLLSVNDETRAGGLRFKVNENYVSSNQDDSIPPYTTLRQLQDASLNIEKDENILNEKWLKELLLPGTSLGGARPKASVVDENGEYWIGKFPSNKDEYDVGAFEKVANELAKMCDINVPESRLERFSNNGSTFISKRFDRINKNRIHYDSAMSLLGKKDGESNDSSYLDLANFITKYGSYPKRDLEQLYRRMIFNMCISNTDDHLRNHGFLLTNNKWELAPAFDLNPCKYSKRLSLKIDEYDNIISFENALNVCEKFYLNKDYAENIIENTKSIVQNNYEKIAKKYSISNNQINYLRECFVVDY